MKIDGVMLPSSQYTVKEGSTIVTLPGDTLDTLAPGSHTITLVYTYGEVSTTLTVKAANTSDGGDEDKPDTTPDTNPDAKPDTPSDTTPDTNPDGNNDASDNTDNSIRTPYRKRAPPARPFGAGSDWLVGSGSGCFSPGICEKRKSSIKISLPV